MPTKTTPRKTRFKNNTGKNKVTRKTRFKKDTATDWDKLAAAIDVDLDRMMGRVAKKAKKAGKRTRRWTDEQNVKAADRATGRHRHVRDDDQGKQRDGTTRGTGGKFYEQLRGQMIRDRNRRRRYPWLPALGAILVGLLAHLIGTLFAATTRAPAEAVALVLAAVPLAVATAVALYHQKTHLQWLPELAVAGIGSAAVVYWIGVAGLSWWTVLVLLVGTIVGGTRWWKDPDNAIGPGVPRLEPALPEPEPQPDPAPSVPPPGKDPYCIAWEENNARGEGKAKGSKLTNRRDDEYTITYDVELKRGAQTITHLLANRAELAGGLGEDVERVLFQKAPRGSGAHMARLTIITRDPTAETRFYTGHRVEDGVIKGVARFVDGRGEADVMMWDDQGTVPTMIVGSTGGGKSGATNVLTCGAMDTGVMNLLYADPKGNSSTALATRARVAIIGKENVLKLPWLVTAMLKTRGDLAAFLGKDLLFPSSEIPGWMFLHDEYSLIANDPLAMRVWTETVNTVRALGIWLVALNQSLSVPQWGNDHARSAFASQVIAFRINSKCSSDLVPGLIFDPNDLPVDDSGPVARPVPGMAVHAHLDTPTRWDFLPSEADAARMKQKGKPAPPYTTTRAFAACFTKCPPVDPADVLALEMVLGPAVNGRWQVGGPGATHRFPDTLEELHDKNKAAAKPRGRWGQRGGKPAGGQLSPVQAEVLAIVRGGTTNTGEIIDAAKAAKSSVHAALDQLTNLGLICKTAHGVYEPVKQDA